GRDLSEREGVGFETRPDGFAVGRDLSERGVARPQRTGLGDRRLRRRLRDSPRCCAPGATSANGKA
ncbi:hypothetical protein, partial [Tessaracoccus lapidicaptus]|uniref:hypothetical protein n=1 Tax=Tessaracoccus lapidicaptus TaxID=1427523 RepID=UPI00333F04EC